MSITVSAMLPLTGIVLTDTLYNFKLACNINFSMMIILIGSVTGGGMGGGVDNELISTNLSQKK